MNRASLIKVSADVLSRTLGNEVVLLDLRSGTYFGLNEVGARFWTLASTGASVGAVLTALESEFDVDPSVLATDIENLTSDLFDKGLIELTAP